MTNKKLGAVALAFVLITGTAGLAMAAAPTVDNETTDTTYTTGLDDAGNQPYNATTDSRLSFSADSMNASVVIVQNGTELAEYTNDSSELQYDTTVSGTSYYNLTVNDDASDYPGLEAGPGENVDVRFMMVNDSTLDNPDTTNITVTFQNDANLTFASFGSDDTEVSEPGRFASLTASAQSLFGDEVNLTDPAKTERSVNVTGADQDTITVHVADADAQAALNETHSESADVGGVTWMGVAQVGGDFVPVMAEGESAPSWIDTSEDAYVEVADGGDQFAVQNAGDVLGSDAESVDVVMVGNEQANFGQVRSLMSEYGVSGFEAWSTAATSGELIPFSDQFDLEA